MTLAEDFNIYIGSSTGALKGVSLHTDKCTVKNIQNVRFLTNKASVLDLNWGNKEETEILIAYRGQKIKIYDVEFKNFNTNTDVSCGEGDIVGVSRYDECILTAVQSGDVKLWRYKTEPDQWTKFNVGANLERMKHNKESNVMATGGKENDLKLWDLNTTQNIFSAKNVKPDEFDLRRPVWVNDIAFLPNSDKVAVCSKQGYVRVYDPKVTTQRRPVLKIDVPDYAFSCLSTTNQNHYILAGTTAGDMIAVDLRGKGKPCYKYKGFAGCVKSITCPQNENIILSVSLDRHFRVHDFHSKKLLRKDYMQSHLTSILIPSDFSLESPVKKTDDETQDGEDEKYDPEHYEMDNMPIRNTDDFKQEDNQDDSGSDLEIIEEIVDSENNNTHDKDDSEEESEDDAEEEESPDDEYYTESEEDKENNEAEEEDEESVDEGENELFPLTNTKKRKTSEDEIPKNIKKSK
uniref:WD repeat-containing protein 74 n=1 Tax=Cacopsylla melanoneura TaxID=428564 RepID=A0A8D9B2H6_9HEMI